MPKINVLDKHTAELIAAGEVVERPASAIKELVENCIDSGATAVTVEIKNGGNTFIRVSDNGCGIEKDDIRNAFLRHATSKIKTQKDLSAIFTLGFRGEALASISSVAKIEMITRTADDEFGYKYVIHGGDELEFEQTGAPLGTTIIVRDLFYNTPARMKFLKKDTTESNAVTAMLERLSVANPEIAFKLFRDGRLCLNTPGDCSMKNCVYSVYGKEFADSLLPVDYSMNGIKVDGFVCKPETTRKSRSMQFFYLNKRYIRSKTAMAALEQAYKNVIMVGKYPGCVLNICIDPQEVDVNVHPAKLEVRFSDENKVFQAVYYAVKSSLNADCAEKLQAQQISVEELLEPAREQFVQLDVNSINAGQRPVAQQKNNFDYNTDYRDTSKWKQSITASDSTAVCYKVTDIAQQDTSPASINISHNKLNSYAEESDAVTPIKPKIYFNYVGQLFETYILVQVDEKLILIDKHAAHERIIFNQISRTTKHEPQMLLAPVDIKLTASAFESIISNLEAINSVGFEIEESGVNTILVRGVPMSLDGRDIKELIDEISGRLTEKYTDFSPEFLEWLYHSVACRAAIKAGNKSSALELSELADTVLNDDTVRYCPHGRPVTTEITLNEIKKRFFRT